MQYLIVQIWALLAAAAVVGLFIGWLIRGGSLGARLRDIRRQLRESENETVRQRDEAARLAAELQRISPTDAISAVSVERLQGQLAEAQAVADREAAAADALRERLSALEDVAEPAATGEDTALSDRVAELEEDNARLEEALAAAREGDAPLALDPEETDALRARIAQLTARLADAEPAAAELADARRELAALRARAADPDGEAVEELAGLRARMSALEDGDEAAFLEGDENRRGHWLAARNRWLERKIEQLQGGEPPAPSAVEAEAIELRARVAELEAGGSAAPRDDEAAGDMAELSRLRWRNRYLVSRVSYLESRAQPIATDETPASGEDAASEIDRLRARNAELEEVTSGGAGGSALQEELERLRTRVVELENAGPIGDEASPEGETYSLEWRNRYLASRVRYLERRLSDAETAAPVASSAGDTAAEAELERLRAQVSGLQAQAEEAPRLRARLAEMQGGGAVSVGDAETEPLRGRIRELEQALEEARDGRGARHEGDYALEWRNRYLTSRVRYLEERLAETRRGGAGAEGDTA